MNNKYFCNFKKIGITATLAAIAVLFAGCGDGNSGTTTPSTIDNDGTDTDGDRIPDTNDRCPNGIGRTEGWTSTAATDADRDGCRDIDEDISDDIDDDDDGLIEIYTLAQLNNMRYNAAGTGYQESSTATAVITGAKTTPTENCASAVDGVYLCGYELMSDLDFDTNGNGRSFTVNRASTTQITATGDEEDAYYNGGSGWDPICTVGCTGFTGIFEGNEHTISNLYINYNGSEINIMGFFGLVSETQIRNVRLENIYVENGVDDDDNIGGLVGTVVDSTIENCHVSGIVQSVVQSQYTGGLVGQAETIISSRFHGSVVGGTYVGGLAGHTSVNVMGSRVTGGPNDIISGINVGGLMGEYSTGTLQASYAAINVDGSNNTAGSIGGLVGLQRSGTIVASYSTGAVRGKDVISLRIGGLVGEQSSGTIVASYSTGAVNGGDFLPIDYDSREFVGGLVGQQSGTIVGSYAAGNISGGEHGNYGFIGGLTGQLASGGTITASYAAGNVKGGKGIEEAVGGLVGRTDNTSTITASYATGNVYGDNGGDEYVGGLVGWHTGTIAASYAAGDVDGGDGDGDDVGGLVGSQNGTITASYSFGSRAGGENDGASPLPAGVTTATALSTTNTNWNTTSGSMNAWDFGDSTQTPALRFAEYDGSGGTDYCGTSKIIPDTFADGTPITCGPSGSPIPGQR